MSACSIPPWGDTLSGAHRAGSQRFARRLGDAVGIAGHFVIDSRQRVEARVLKACMYRRRAKHSDKRRWGTSRPAGRPVGSCNSRLTGHSLNASEQMLLLQDGNIIFEARLVNLQVPAIFKTLREGSLLQVTGICTIEVDENRQPKRFSVRLRFPKDVVVVDLPPWWNASRILTLIGAMVVLILAALLWAGALRRRVDEATEMIRTTLESTADGILVVDANGKVATFNRKFVQNVASPRGAA
jgi:PAS domain-containing protein